MMDEILKARRDMKESDDRRDAGLKVPEDVECFYSIPYGEDGIWQILDVYRPKNAVGALPVIVNVHGGGWIYGTKETYRFYCMDLARRGFAVVNFTYRLAPEHMFPASLEDTCSVFGWVLENAERFGFDAKRVFAVGDSAGGHILSLFCAMCTDPEYAMVWDFSAPHGFVPTAVALNCGSYHHELPAEGPAHDLMLAVLSGGVSEETVAAVDAPRHVKPGFPPVFLMTSSEDFLRHDALNMACSLIDASVPFELHFYGDKENGLGHVFHVDMNKPEAAVCNDEECAFFRKFC